MADTALVELLDDIQAQATAELLDMMESIYGTMLGPDGRTYGDQDLSRGERIARVVDMAQRGVLAILQTISPDVFDDIHAQFIRDVAASPLETQ